MFNSVNLAHMIKQPQPSTSPDRRGFMRGMLTMITGGFALLAPLLGGLALLLDPLRRNKNETSGAFIMVARLASLPANGIPVKFDILSNRKDAWNRYSNVPVGSIYLRRTKNEHLAAFNIICPHAGCFVQIDSQKPQFNCPCHESQFHFDGTKANPNNPSPRGMDPLKLEIRNGDEIWVQYQSFKTGMSERIPTS